MAALSASVQGVWVSKWRDIFILLPPHTHTYTHYSKHCHLWVCLCVQPWLTSWRGMGWNKAGKLACSAGSAQVFDSFQGPLMFLAYPHLCPTILLTSPHAGNCILTTVKADKWGRRGTAHCHQQTCLMPTTYSMLATYASIQLPCLACRSDYICASTSKHIRMHRQARQCHSLIFIF